MILTESKFMLIGVAVAALALIVMVKKKGVAAAAAEKAAELAVELAAGAAKGTLDGISTAIGIPDTDHTITDPVKCREYMDANGWSTGLYACGAPAFNTAIQPVQAVKETATGIWDWLTKPSASDYQPVTNTGAFDRQ